MDNGSLLSSLATSFLIFMVLILLFVFLSRMPGNAVIYYPNHLLKSHESMSGSTTTRTPFAWIKEALSTSNDIYSVDTSVYFVFLSTVLGILLFSGVVLLPVLLPVVATEKITDTPCNTTYTVPRHCYELPNYLDKYSIQNLEEGSPRVLAHVIAVYWVSLVTYYFLWRAYERASDLRTTALMSADVKAEQFAVLVRDIPPLPDHCATRKEQVDTYFRSIYSDAFYRSIVITDSRKASKIWEELKGWKMKLERSHTIYESSKTDDEPQGTRPTIRTGLFGLIGEKVDSIDYINTKIRQVSAKLESEQRVITPNKKQRCSAIVFFTSRVVAAAAAQSLHDRMVDTWTVMEAPEPRQIIWTNLPLNFYERRVRQYVVYILVAITLIFYAIPIGLLSAFTTLESLVKYLPSLKPVSEIRFLRPVLEAYLPQLGLLVFLFVLPMLLKFLSEMEGIPCVNQASRATSAKYFYFTIVISFLGVSQLQTLLYLHGPKTTFTEFAVTLPVNATFFFTYIAFRCFFDFGLEISRLVPLIIFHLRKKFICKTEAEIKEAWAPGELDYSTRFPRDMLIFTIVICYSVVAPLIIPFGMVYFGLEWLVIRNQALNVYVPSYESKGRMWPHMHTRMVAALLLFQVTMWVYFQARSGYALQLFPLFIITVVFGYVCWKKFYRSFKCTALEVASHALETDPDMQNFYRSYAHPSLQLAEDDNTTDAFSRLESSV